MMRAQDLASLQGDLDDECRLLDALVQATEREHAAILGELPEELTHTAEEKQRLVEHIAELAERRRTRLRAGGVPDGMDGLLRCLPPESRLHALWQRTRARASKAEQMNHSSGVLLRLHAARLQARIGAFMNAAAPAATYSPGGVFALQGRRALGAF